MEWASGAVILGSGAGGVWESEAGLRKQKGKKQSRFACILATCSNSLHTMDKS